jgi:hypothetical protein
MQHAVAKVILISISQAVRVIMLKSGSSIPQHSMPVNWPIWAGSRFGARLWPRPCWASRHAGGLPRTNDEWRMGSARRAWPICHSSFVISAEGTQRRAQHVLVPPRWAVELRRVAS